MIRPIVSPSISIPWYNLCAICIVLEAPNPYFPDDVCCSVEVVKGAEGFLFTTLEFTSLIKYSCLLIISVAKLISFFF